MAKKLQLFLLFSIFLFTAYSQPLQLKEIYKLKTTEIRDQKEIGSCWAFGVIAMIETDLLNHKKINVDLSENFILYYTYLNKAQMYLMMHGYSNFGEGGQGHDVLNVIREYGIVPESAYPYNLSSHSEMVKELKAYLDSLNCLDTLSVDWKTGFIRILNSHMTCPPKEFEYNGKKYTPKTFYQYLEFNVDDYISLSSFTHHDFYKYFILEVPDNWAKGMYFNLPIAKLLEIIDFALENKYSVGWDGDVSTKGFIYDEGIADFNEYFNAKFSQFSDQQYRQFLFMRKTTTDDHLACIIGVFKNPQNKKYYLIKNSWGVTNKTSGFIYFSDKFLVYQTIAIIVHKNALPEDLKKIIAKD